MNPCEGPTVKMVKVVKEMKGAEEKGVKVVGITQRAEAHKNDMLVVCDT